MIAETHKFRQRAQRHDETMARYVSALFEILALRDFGNAEQDIICDQFAEKAYNECICERLLLDDKLALDKAIHIANRVESTACDASTFWNSDVPVWEISKPLKGEEDGPAVQVDKRKVGQSPHT